MDLSSLSPFAKAIVPALLTVVTVVIKWAVDGTFDQQTAAIAITGLLAAIITYLVPNSTLVAKPPVKHRKPSSEP